MIVGGKSSTGRGLGAYLTEGKNEKAEIWELQSGRRDLTKAIDDWRSYAHGTNAEKPIYHAWLAPSDGDRALTREEWDKAIALFEKEMGLEGQPRAIIHHQPQDEREAGHIHLVYSRIQDGKAISNSWDYLHHQKARAEMEKAFDLAHVYAPLLDDEPRRAQSFDQDAKEQGKRLGIDAKEIKAEVSEIYRSADSGRAFVAGLEDAGYSLARGDSRNYVILDEAGGVHSLSRMAGVKVAELRDRLRDYPAHGLPSVDEARELAQTNAKRPEQEQGLSGLPNSNFAYTLGDSAQVTRLDSEASREAFFQQYEEAMTKAHPMQVVGVGAVNSLAGMSQEEFSLRREATAELYGVGTLEREPKDSGLIEGKEADAPTLGRDDPAAEGMNLEMGAVNAVADGLAGAVGGLFWNLAGGDPKPKSPPAPEQSKAKGDKAERLAEAEKFFQERDEERQRQKDREKGRGLDRGRGLERERER